ncbi:cardiolipin synthase [Tamilnaduibacter salinus]|uniref:CDP-diacylglycerol--glycerol-3-phosphate 3-phosphatidyltransferase n=1 Tax=Tamilnaduibacter salinus TaxID=1484056 RepID=A0A2A2I1S7_9GAMM|nr:CDP-alcohol phosphatidyltransferase family protein [Tamilnaduibacter salinus]PAV25085.1 CDP-alcohol phosphatidyltransferase [Tamilnaduibacter salinus]PVY69575.1 cardiolipin synthase [Tamilnaduibacter salinus]
MARAWNWIPNALTLVRIVLILPFAMSLYHGDYRFALVVFLAAAITDGVDGFLARQFDWGSRLGAIADPLADKALLITAYLMLTLTSVLPVWLFVLVLGRDLLIVLGGVAFHFLVGRFDMAPSIPGKLNTLVQILVILAIVMRLAGLPMHSWVLPWGIWLVAAMTLFSGIHYGVVWGLRAWKAVR